MNTIKIRFIIIFLIVIQFGCTGFLRKEEATVKSVFNKEEFLYVNQTLFPEYEWSENARIADSLYVQGLVDHFFNQDYIRAIPYFIRARDVYPKDVRVYVRLIESYARINRYEDALQEIERGNQEIIGFLNIEGISHYRDELIAASSGVLLSQQSNKGIWGTIKGIPGVLWRGLKKLWIF